MMVNLYRNKICTIRMSISIEGFDTVEYGGQQREVNKHIGQ